MLCGVCGKGVVCVWKVWSYVFLCVEGMVYVLYAQPMCCVCEMAVQCV